MKLNLLFVILLISLVIYTQAFKQHKKSHNSLRKDHKDYQNFRYFCPGQVYRNDTEFQSFMGQISDQYTDEKLESLGNYCNSTSLVFSPSQVVEILKEVNFVSDQIKAIKIMNNYIPYLTSDELLEILDVLTFTDDKLKGLKKLAPLVLNLNYENKQTIIESFTFSSSMKKARKILDNTAERNCLFGTVDDKVAVFVIDQSGSMNEEISTSYGYISRLNYVKLQLRDTISTQLRDYQRFNIVVFSSSVRQWQQQPVQATPENIQDAIDYINSLYAYGATNISGALNTAFHFNPDVNGIYFLTDGVPSTGITDFDAMIQLVNDLEDQRGQSVKINTISFMVGGSESEYSKQTSRQFLEAIALSSNGGSFKQMTSF